MQKPSYINYAFIASLIIAHLSYLQARLLPLHTPNHDIRRILRDNLVIMQHLELYSQVSNPSSSHESYK